MALEMRSGKPLSCVPVGRASPSVVLFRRRYASASLRSAAQA